VQRGVVASEHRRHTLRCALLLPSLLFPPRMLCALLLLLFLSVLLYCTVLYNSDLLTLPPLPLPFPPLPFSSSSAHDSLHFITSTHFIYLTSPSSHLSCPLVSSSPLHHPLHFVPVPVVEPFTGLTAKVTLLHLLGQAVRYDEGCL
jgi:hypothetical protein